MGNRVTRLKRTLAAAWFQLGSSVHKLGRGAAIRQRRHAAPHGGTSSFAEPLAGEVWETAATVVVQIEMPGMRPEDVQVSFSRGQLRIRAYKHRVPNDAPGRTYHLKERAFGRFERRISLPQGVEATLTEISYKDGVMTVIVPKETPSPPVQGMRGC